MTGIMRGVLALLAVAEAAAFTPPVAQIHHVVRTIALAATATDGSTAALLAKLESLEKELHDIKASLTTASAAATEAPAVKAMNAAYVARGREALESR